MGHHDIRFHTAADGARIAWAMHGDGYPLVRVGTFMTHLLHDWESPTWRHWLDDLGARFTYVRYDERGCGLSSRHPPELSLRTWLADLHGVIESTGFDRVALLGMSHAACLAVAYAAEHPERVSHIVSLGGYAVGSSVAGGEPEAAEKSRVFWETVRVYWEDPDDMLRRAWSMTLVPDGTAADVASVEELMRRSSSGEMAARIFAERDRLDVRKLATKVHAPVLVAHARRDQMVPFGKALELAGLLPNASLLALDTGNHVLLPGEAWDRFVTETARFVGVQPRRTRARAGDELTDRERQVLALVAEGLSNDEIAARVALSRRTVERHLSNIYRRLGLAGRTARAAAAAQYHSIDR